LQFSGWGQQGAADHIIIYGRRVSRGRYYAVVQSEDGSALILAPPPTRQARDARDKTK
jgi:hypothetical protein